MGTSTAGELTGGLSLAVVLAVALLPRAAPAQAGAGAPPDSCARGPEGNGAAGLEGELRDRGSSLPLAGIRLLLEVPGAQAPGGGAVRRAGRTAEGGSFRFCRLPGGVTARLTVRDPASGTGARTEVWLPRDSVARHLLEMELGPPGRLRGQLVDRESGEPVEGATLSLPQFGIRKVSSGQGRFELPPLPGGRHRVQVQHVAYGNQSDTLAVEPGRSTTVVLHLEARPVVVDPLEVTVTGVRSLWLERNGFYRRMESGHGRYVTREEIEERDPLRVSDLFRRVSGVEVMPNGQLQMKRAPTSLVSGQRCRIQYFVDGRSLSLPNGVDSFLPGDIAGIEVYRGASEIPPEFNEGRVACGAVMLWLQVERR